MTYTQPGCVEMLRAALPHPTCAVCHRPVRLDPNGRARRHGWDGAVCDGSGLVVEVRR